MPSQTRLYDLEHAWEYCRNLIRSEVIGHVILDDIHVIYDSKEGTFSHYRGGYAVASDDWGNPNPQNVEVYCFEAGDVDPTGEHHSDAEECSQTKEEYDELFVESVLDQMQDQFYADHEEGQQETVTENVKN